MALILLAVLLVGCLLAPLLGTDSRQIAGRDRRGWFPTRNRGL